MGEPGAALTHRFVVGGDLALSREQARQIAAVLRLQAGDVVTLVHGGDEIEYRLTSVSRTGVRGEVVARRRATAEPRLRLVLAVPLLRGDHTELVLESTTQLGVHRFVPYVSARTVRQVHRERRERWERIVREAVETSRRGHVPEIDEVRDWPTLLRTLVPPIVVAWERETSRALLEELPRDATEASLVIGPEGGLEDEEIAAAREAGAVTVSLGARNLRAETAAIAAVAIALARSG